MINTEAALIEVLADIEHKRWSSWEEHLHSKCVKNDDGSLTIPAEHVTRWTRQIETNYYDLSEKEKESDRREVMSYFELVKRYFLPY